MGNSPYGSNTRYDRGGIVAFLRFVLGVPCAWEGDDDAYIAVIFCVCRRFVRQRFRTVDRDLSGPSVYLVQRGPISTIFHRSILFYGDDQRIQRAKGDVLRRYSSFLVRVIRFIICHRVEQEAGQAADFRIRRERSFAVDS